MHIKRLLVLIVFLVSMLFGTKVFAICAPMPTTGDDIINCTDSAFGIDVREGNDYITVVSGATIQSIVGNLGDDSIINNGSIITNIDGGPGNDSIVNNGTAGPVYGDGFPPPSAGGDDTIINNGTAEELVGDTSAYSGNDTIINTGIVLTNISSDIGDDFISFPGPGTDLIINYGTVGGPISAVNGNDTVILGGNANGGADHYLWINGGGDYDTLILAYDDPAVDAAVAANAPNGSITVNGETFEWRNFEQIVKGEPVSSPDGGLNGSPADNARTAAVYCSPYDDGGVIVYGIDANNEGYLLFTVSADDAHDALEQAQASGEHVMIAEQDGQSLWALTSSELQIHDADGLYDFIFAPAICGIPPAS